MSWEGERKGTKEGTRTGSKAEEETGFTDSVKAKGAQARFSNYFNTFARNVSIIPNFGDYNNV